MSGFRISASYGDRARLTPLLKLLEEGVATGAIAISAERVHLYEWELGALNLVHDWEAEMYMTDWRERKAQKPANLARTQGASASGRDQFDQRLEHNRARFLEETGRLVADEARSRGWRRVIGFGDPEYVRELAEGAHEKEAEVELADEADVISEPRHKVLDRVNRTVTAGNRRRELALIERALEAAATPGGHGALGITDVQRSLNEGRVEHLLFDADPENSDLADLEDEIVERAFRTSAEVTPVAGDAAEALREHDGVAALLRY
jgi:stalled ribosome rescue protein Dom34